MYQCEKCLAVFEEPGYVKGGTWKICPICENEGYYSVISCAGCGEYMRDGIKGTCEMCLRELHSRMFSEFKDIFLGISYSELKDGEDEINAAIATAYDYVLIEKRRAKNETKTDNAK